MFKIDSIGMSVVFNMAEAPFDIFRGEKRSLCSTAGSFRLHNVCEYLLLARCSCLLRSRGLKMSRTKRKPKFEQVYTRTAHGNSFSKPFDVTDGLYQQCCDCALVHHWKFSVNERGRIMAVVREQSGMTKKVRKEKQR